MIHPSEADCNCGDIYVEDAGETMALRKHLQSRPEPKTKYSLEVQAPGCFDDPPILKLVSETPPMTVNVGDLINLRGSSRALRMSDFQLLEVSKVEHLFSDSLGRDGHWTEHKIMVFTKAAKDEASSRVPGYPA